MVGCGDQTTGSTKRSNVAYHSATGRLHSLTADERPAVFRSFFVTYRPGFFNSARNGVIFSIVSRKMARSITVSIEKF